MVIREGSCRSQNEFDGRRSRRADHDDGRGSVSLSADEGVSNNDSVNGSGSAGSGPSGGMLGRLTLSGPAQTPLGSTPRWRA